MTNTMSYWNNLDLTRDGLTKQQLLLCALQTNDQTPVSQRVERVVNPEEFTLRCPHCGREFILSCKN